MYLTLPQFDVLYDAPDFLSSYVNYRYMNDLVNTRNTQKDEAVSSPLATDLINYKIIVWNEWKKKKRLQSFTRLKVIKWRGLFREIVLSL